MNVVREDLLERSPRMCPASRWQPTDGGGLDWHGPSGRHVLRWPGAHSWLERMVPFLDGQRTVRQMAGGLSKPRREKLLHLVEALYAGGLLEDSPTPEAGPLPRDILKRLSLWGSHSEQTAPFVAKQRLLLVGDGPLLAQLADALVRCGVGELCVLPLHDAPSLDAQALPRANSQAMSQKMSQAMSQEKVRWLPPCGNQCTDICDALGRELQRQVSATVSVTRCRDVATSIVHACADYGSSLAQTLSSPDGHWTLRAKQPAAARQAWDSFLRRRDSVSSWQDARAVPTRGPAATHLAAATIALGHIRWLAEASVASEGPPASLHTVSRLGPTSFGTSKHRLLVHPLALPAEPDSRAAFVARQAMREAGAPLTPTTFARAAALFADERVGAIARCDHGHYQQLPLWVARISVSDPVGRLAESGCSTAVYGAALEFRQARHRAARQALALYANSLFDARRALSEPGTPRAGAPMSDASRPLVGSVWGYALDTQEPTLVPARTAFFLDRSAPGRGVACGDSYWSAVDESLLQVCLEWVLAKQQANSACSWLSPSSVEGLSNEAKRLVDITQRAAIAVDVAELHHPLPLRTLSFFVGDRNVASASGWTLSEALEVGLTKVVLHWQARTSRHPEYAPPLDSPVSRPPRTHKSGGTERPETPAAQRASEPRQELVRALSKLSLSPVAVALDHDAELSRLLPYLIRVILMERDADGGLAR